MSLLKAINTVGDQLEIAPCIGVSAVHSASDGVLFGIKGKYIYLGP